MKNITKIILIEINTKLLVKLHNPNKNGLCSSRIWIKCIKMSYAGFPCLVLVKTSAISPFNISFNIFILDLMSSFGICNSFFMFMN